MRIITYILILSTTIISCNDLKLIKSDIEYSKLPIEVKDYIFESKFKDLNKPEKYKVENYQTLLPWIYKTKIIRLRDNKSYKINFDKEFNISTLIINDSLYTTNNYNIYPIDSLKYTFSKYLIK